MVKKRESNFELLRIFLMVMIITGHVSVHHENPYVLTNGEEIFKLFLWGMICVSVNTFILISGYFGIQFKKDRLLRLIIQTMFYSIVFMIIAIIFGWRTFNARMDLFALLPIITKQYWFVTCYVVLYILSPWINIWVGSLNVNMYRRFLLTGFLIVYLWPTFNYLINAPQFIRDAGYGIVNFIYLYMLGRYIHLYYEEKHSSFFYGCGYLISTIILFICQYSLSWLLGFEFTSWLSYNTLFCLISSVCLFMAFKNLSFYSAKINYWAKPCLAVYLIHMAPNILSVICCIYIGVQDYHGYSWFCLILTLPTIIYFASALVEIGRRKILGSVEDKIIAVFHKYEKKIIICH